jgi:hypothetical protein
LPKRKDNPLTPKNNENEDIKNARKAFLISNVLGISRGMKGYGIKPAASAEAGKTVTKKPKRD